MAFSIPPALKASGGEIAIITPLYQCVRTRFGDSLTKVLELYHPEFGCGLQGVADMVENKLYGILSAIKVYFGEEKTFALLRRRCMEKDFSWTKSAGQYNRMYTEISDSEEVETIPFEEAFALLKTACEEVDRAKHARRSGIWTPGWRRVIQFQVTGNLAKGAEIQWLLCKAS